MTVLLSFGGLVCTMSTSMIAPALNQISIDLDMQPSVMQLTLSIYLLAFVFGSPIIASLSEVYGRKPAYILAHVWYILWNTLCPINKSKGLVIAGRFLSGFGGSVSIAVSLQATRLTYFEALTSTSYSLRGLPWQTSGRQTNVVDP